MWEQWLNTLWKNVAGEIGPTFHDQHGKAAFSAHEQWLRVALYLIITRSQDWSKTKTSTAIFHVWCTRDNCPDSKMTFRINLCASWSKGTTAPDNTRSPQMFKIVSLYGAAKLCVCTCKQRCTGSSTSVTEALLSKFQPLHFDCSLLWLYRTELQHRGYFHSPPQLVILDS